MNDDTLVRLAREAGFSAGVWKEDSADGIVKAGTPYIEDEDGRSIYEQLKKFAELVAVS